MVNMNHNKHTRSKYINQIKAKYQGFTYHAKNEKKP